MKSISCSYCRISGDLYSKEEVEEIIRKISQEVSRAVETELDASTRMAAVFIQMLMNEAQKAGLNFQAEVSYMEN